MIMPIFQIRKERLRDVIQPTPSHLPISCRWWCCLVATLYSTLCNPMDCSPPDSSVHGIFQVRILEWVCLIVIRIFANLTSILWYLIVMLLCIFLTLNLVYWTFGFLHLRTPSSRLCPLPYWVVVFLLIWTEDYLRILGLWVDKSSDTF